MVSLRALSPSLTRITIAAVVGAALHIGKGDSNIVDQTALKVATDGQSKGKISLDMSIEEIVQTVASQKDLLLENFTVDHA
jgi:fructose-1,6-bisphosphatase/sedoheptulose 1,7-bisphosphatase-like protein